MTFREKQEERIRAIGGEELLQFARERVEYLKLAPPFDFPPKAEMEKELMQLRNALARASRELRYLISTLHGLNARRYGFGSELPERFDVIGYLEALLNIRYAKPRGDAVRQTIVMETLTIFQRLGLPIAESRSGGLVRYLEEFCAAIGKNLDAREIARDVIKFHQELIQASRQ